jgi:7-carboxy-7-deazaguanine synthase
MERTIIRLQINEIYHCIQGESRHAGRPCVLVRLTSCNLRCVWCDTPYAFEEGDWSTVDAILEQVASHGTRYVLITGGEPLLQPGVHALIRELLDRGYEVAVETGGSLDIAPIDRRAMVVMDIKCPGSGMRDRNREQNIGHLKATDDVKFVVADRADYEWARDLMVQHRLPQRCGVLLSPVHVALDPGALARWILEDHLAARLQLQIHKYIWPGAGRRV